MRRPLKPFVTEYRGGSRRQAAGGQTPKPDFSSLDLQPPAAENRGADHRAAARMADPAEDSYEAALRAADALFEARQPAAAPGSGQGPGPASQPPETPSAPSPSGGRVLRVLDEPPSPELLRLEAERAPKRRGRKPGSKNKPKPIAPVVAQEILAQEILAQEAGAAAPAEASVADSAEPVLIPAVAARLTALRRSPTVQTADKYAWVRTKLKPGQQWKRRLPKVAW